MQLWNLVGLLGIPKAPTMAADGGARSRQRLNSVLHITIDGYFKNWLASSKSQGVFYFKCMYTNMSEKVNVTYPVSFLRLPLP